jgi:hypothetical protein
MEQRCQAATRAWQPVVDLYIEVWLDHYSVDE